MDCRPLRNRPLPRGRRRQHGDDDEAADHSSLARSAVISVETVRSIEKGRTSTPEFFTVAALAAELGLSLDELYAHALHLDPNDTPAPRP
ncbi:helix-turn-helix transcriptional regulator [Streptomyces sp. ISL-86]|uniref:helix-turn-helix domain-containing protein n=1 Tax=unclassified Streptomyces TaxID=2593676 RepID=UPI001BEBDAD5|nr:helix-turn-helix transcriptional regulator [Streptomyces sp. ISL-21]MBT2459870.1 helix-turn-helix transcriptional regulator [Streptomyces sp. ISL-86]MBT2611810.1 helix-turn-helix transcriptional regulator [Streptomyces sp. ISL-87]